MQTQKLILKDTYLCHSLKWIPITAKFHCFVQGAELYMTMLSEIGFSISYALMKNIIWWQFQYEMGVRKHHGNANTILSHQSVLTEYFTNSFTMPWKAQHLIRNTLQTTVKDCTGIPSNLLYFWSHFVQVKIS